MKMGGLTTRGIGGVVGVMGGSIGTKLAIAMSMRRVSAAMSAMISMPSQKWGPLSTLATKIWYKGYVQC